jgi:enoyl-CoA hydratase/carnithine racemase
VTNRPYKHLLVERTREEGVAVVTLDREDKLNALAHQTRAELAEALSELGAETGVRAIVLKGSGNRAFCAGADLNESKTFAGDDVTDWIDSYDDLYSAVLDCDAPTVAAIDGYAVGSGLQLALLCDLRVATYRARLGMPEIDDAVPCITGTWTLYDLVGRARTTELILTGRLVNADEALAWGLVNAVVPEDELMDEAMALASTLARKPRTAIRLNKERLRTLLRRDHEDTISFAKAAHAHAYGTGEPQEAMAHFLAGRRDDRSR